MERKRFQTGFLAARENGIKRANILEFEVVMLVLKIQPCHGIVSLVISINIKTDDFWDLHEKCQSIHKFFNDSKLISREADF